MNAAAVRDLLISWANLNSGSDHFAGLECMRIALAAEFATLRDATVEHIALGGTTAKILRVRVRPAAPLQLLLSGHYDTVYGATHPFQTCTLLDDHILRGPGVADMKGGLVVMLTALRELEDSPHAARLGFEILLTPDEETGSVASCPVLEATARSGRCAFALVFEPARANGNLVKSRNGTGAFTVTVRGRAAHAGRDPENGRNAILALAEILPRIDALGRELPGVMINLGTIRGGGTVNIVPDLASADLNVRITRVGDDAAFFTRLDALLAAVNAREGYRAERTGQFNRGPKVETPFEEKLFAAWQQCAREFGVTLSWQHVAGGSDGNLLSAAGLANLDGLGPVGDRLHSPEEFVYLPSLTERAQIAARFLAKLAAGNIALSIATD
jgi:glutamate carboxypeptidase